MRIFQEQIALSVRDGRNFIQGIPVTIGGELARVIYSSETRMIIRRMYFWERWLSKLKGEWSLNKIIRSPIW